MLTYIVLNQSARQSQEIPGRHTKYRTHINYVISTKNILDDTSPVNKFAICYLFAKILLLKHKKNMILKNLSSEFGLHVMLPTAMSAI